MRLAVHRCGNSGAGTPWRSAPPHTGPAPAPLIGSGVPVAPAVGGVLLATNLFARRRRS
jgi:hypothetical protein